ncbi:PP2C family protein-serine/threonine phosphatase [Streptomyces deccanensis]|uniref:PP2C family protein-serine/threonine phosphatase n=1 Tax=Streptomyces deccanensis TaxID=424188 RepID=UPI0030B85B37
MERLKASDRVARVIGDVMGHGIAEAATMGRLRTVVRPLADLEMPPDELFSRRNDLVAEFGEDFYATCLYAVFDPVARTCTYCLAGHLPPVIVHSPDVAPGPPLGAAKAFSSIWTEQDLPRPECRTTPRPRPGAVRCPSPPGVR